MACAVCILISVKVYSDVARSRPAYNKDSSRSEEEALHGGNEHIHTSFKELSHECIGGVERLVIFVGHCRSGSSVLGSLLDAHPHVLIAHEYDLFGKLLSSPQHFHNRSVLYRELYQNSWEQSHKETGPRNPGSKSRKGYSLAVNGSWQGSFTRLKVIGDKSPRMTTNAYSSSPEKFGTVYKDLKRMVGVPVSVVMALRNPFDMIATTVLYEVAGKRSGKKPKSFSATNKFVGEAAVEMEALKLFHQATTVENMIKRLDLNKRFLEVHNADLVKNCRATMKRLCRFLELDCPSDYLALVESIVFPSVSQSRASIAWSTNLISMVSKGMQKHSFYNIYNFTSD